MRDNVAYDITGHAYFMEDGNETNNYITGNLGVHIRRSSALLKVCCCSFSGFCVYVLCGHTATNCVLYPKRNKRVHLLCSFATIVLS